jgi:hypothetical protein
MFVAQQSAKSWAPARVEKHRSSVMREDTREDAEVENVDGEEEEEEENARADTIGKSSRVASSSSSSSSRSFILFIKPILVRSAVRLIRYNL